MFEIWRLYAFLLRPKVSTTATTTTTVWPVLIRIISWHVWVLVWVLIDFMLRCDIRAVIMMVCFASRDCKVFWMNALKYEVFGETAIENGSVANAGIWDGSVWSVPLWELGSYELGEHHNMCVSLKDQREDMWLLPPSIPTACSPFSPSPLSPFMCSLLFKLVFFSSLSSGVRRSSPSV